MDFPPNEESPRLLVVDDEQIIREILSDFLTMEGFVVHTEDDGDGAVAELKRRSYDLVLSDLKMPRKGGLELLETINQLGLNVTVVIMTGYGTVETAIEAMKKGAYDYILKPFKVDEVVHVVRRGLDRQRLQMENMRLKETLGLYRISEALTHSLSVEPILDLVADAALEETRADLVTLMLAHPGDNPGYETRIRTCRLEADDLPGELNIDELLAAHRENIPLLAQGERAHRFFRTLPESHRLVSFCSVPLKMQHRVVGMLNLFSFSRGLSFTEGQRKMLSIVGSRAAGSIENARLYEHLVRSNQELEAANLSLEENFRQTIVAFALALEENDPYTRGHSERVSHYARLAAEGLGMEPEAVETVVQAALMHDIGKIGIQNEHLNKAGALTTDEIGMFRTHPEKGKRILEPIPFLRKLIAGCFSHHEHFDGTGYPQGLRGEEIPLLGRVIAVADTYDAMTTDRAYRKALPHAEAIAELKRCAGTQFDGAIVEVFVRELERRRLEQARVEIISS